MKKIYRQPETLLLQVRVDEPMLNTSIYSYNNPSSTDQIADGSGDAVGDDDGIIWNNAKGNHGGVMDWTGWD
jgi:hypothetical protein